MIKPGLSAPAARRRVPRDPDRGFPLAAAGAISLLLHAAALSLLTGAPSQRPPMPGLTRHPPVIRWAAAEVLPPVAVAAVEMPEPAADRSRLQPPPEPEPGWIVEAPAPTAAEPALQAPAEVLGPPPPPARESSPELLPPPPEPAPESEPEPAPAPTPEPAPAPVATEVRATAPVPAQDNPPPEYPALSRRRGEQGVVVLRVRCDAQGRVTEVAVQSSSGSPRLDHAALQAVAAWRFEPARAGGRAVAGELELPIRFRLQDRDG